MAHSSYFTTSRWQFRTEEYRVIIPTTAAGAPCGAARPGAPLYATPARSSRRWQHRRAFHVKHTFDANRQVVRPVDHPSAQRNTDIDPCFFARRSGSASTHGQPPFLFRLSARGSYAIRVLLPAARNARRFGRQLPPRRSRRVSTRRQAVAAGLHAGHLLAPIATVSYWRSLRLDWAFRAGRVLE